MCKSETVSNAVNFEVNRQENYGVRHKSCWTIITFSAMEQQLAEMGFTPAQWFAAFKCSPKRVENPQVNLWFCRVFSTSKLARKTPQQRNRLILPVVAQSLRWVGTTFNLLSTGFYRIQTCLVRPVLWSIFPRELPLVLKALELIQTKSSNRRRWCECSCWAGTIVRFDDFVHRRT